MNTNERAPVSPPSTAALNEDLNDIKRQLDPLFDETLHIDENDPLFCDKTHNSYKYDSFAFLESVRTESESQLS